MPCHICGHWGGVTCETVPGTSDEGLAMRDTTAWWLRAWLHGALLCAPRHELA
jgi:hypothetical protein